ncbi:MAG: HEPN domain-containing protein, partial [FCB group bacterium]|nr:HEPN domain-containing protein [FCB group bacterium]
LSKIEPFGNIRYSDLCYHAQQAVEKSLKALLIHFRIELIKTHNIGRLIDQLAKDIEIPQNIRKSDILSKYAIDFRYPGDYEDITQEDWKIAAGIAQKVINWAKRIIEKQ